MDLWKTIELGWSTVVAWHSDFGVDFLAPNVEPSCGVCVLDLLESSVDSLVDILSLVEGFLVCICVFQQCKTFGGLILFVHYH